MNLPAGFEVFLGLQTDFLFVGSGLRRSTRPQPPGGSRPGGAIALMSEPRGDRRPLGKDPETACKEEERTWISVGGFCLKAAGTRRAELCPFSADDLIRYLVGVCRTAVP